MLHNVEKLLLIKRRPHMTQSGHRPAADLISLLEIIIDGA